MAGKEKRGETRNIYTFVCFFFVQTLPARCSGIMPGSGNSLTALDIESILMEIRGKGARQRSTIRSNLHALTPQARLIDNPCVIVTSVKSPEHPRPIAIN